MLNWSFANNLSLLDWTDADFRDYVGFIQSPGSDWASPSIQPRFLVSPGKDYHDYPINPEWKLFHSTRASKSSDAIDRNVWKREITLTIGWKTPSALTHSSGRLRLRVSFNLKELWFQTLLPMYFSLINTW